MIGSTIKEIKAIQILDSRGTPTVEVCVVLNNGTYARASVPSGASTGAAEALELRDHKQEYLGLSVQKAVKNVNTIIAPALINKNATNQTQIDNLMLKLDGTKNKTKLGANAILGVSMAVCRAAANYKKMPLYKYLSTGKASTLPMPMMNVLNGGKHADSSLNIQEFMIAPLGAKSWEKALKMCDEVFLTLKKTLKADGLSTAVGDEGGFAPNLNSDEDALKYLIKAITNAGYAPYKDFGIALDIAASEMYNAAEKEGQTGKYYFWKSKKFYSAPQLLKYYEKLIEKYPIVSIEDGFAEEDWNAWTLMTAKLGNKIQIVGDDLFVTNPQRLSIGINKKSANAILIKLNQIGTVTETLKCIALAQKNNFNTVISHRSGETEDTFIADLAVATNAGQIKSGAPSRGERVAKYNQLLRIENELNADAAFAGAKVFKK
ncbi:MAG: phosphopyruvate hydratase [Clostridia bacterium]|nr:phosphopyruvate hydratase [Clostridia bacterium]